MSDYAGDGPLGGGMAGDVLKAVKDSARSTALQQVSRIRATKSRWNNPAGHAGEQTCSGHPDLLLFSALPRQLQ
jgi:hypothetical protein